MARSHKEQKGIKELKYTVTYLGTASVSFVSNDYGFLYELMKR